MGECTGWLDRGNLELIQEISEDDVDVILRNLVERQTSDDKEMSHGGGRFVNCLLAALCDSGVSQIC